MKTIDDINLESKNVLLRTDLNLPVENGEPQKTVRFERYLETIKELSDKDAKTVVMAHQGRPARNDFTTLEKHAEMISEALDKDVNFVQTFFGPQLGDAVASMEDGDVTVLENIRFLSEELQNASPERHSHDYFVQSMKPYFDVYVDDAFSTAHRSHASIVGFTQILDSFAGPVMINELESCDSVRREFENGVLVLGGEKTSDIIGMIKHMADEVDKILLGGIPGEVALKIKGKGSETKNNWIKENSYDVSSSDLEKLMEKHSEKFMLPEDLKTESGNYSVEDVPDDEMTWDIGEKTEKRYTEIIKNSDAVVMKGPMGAFEEYPEGSKKILEALSKSNGFTVLGGGHTSSLVQRFGYKLDDFSHVSIAGGAFVRYMSGEELPAIKALK